MKYVRIYDNKKKDEVRVVLESDNIIRAHYFNRSFPGATGIIYKDNNLKAFITYIIIQEKNI